MMSAAWLPDLLGVLMLVVAAVSATRLATARWPANRLPAIEPAGSHASPRGSGGADTDIAHLLMGVAMAGMLPPYVKTLPAHAWEAIFGLLTAWFAWRLAGGAKVNGLRSLKSGHRAAHLLHCAAMIYMFAALATSDGMDMTRMCGAMARSPRHPALALAFAFGLVGCCVWDLLGQLAGRRCSLRGASSAGAAPAGAPMAACRIAMGATMAFMLLMPS